MSFLKTRYGIGVLTFLVLAGYFLWAEHSAHIMLAVPYLPGLILLACPLMHVFMHSGHNHNHRKRNASLDEGESKRSDVSDSRESITSGERHG